jgi:isopenicillin-N epimerase
MTLDRRQLLTSLAAGAVASRLSPARSAVALPAGERPLRSLSGEVDWGAVRELFPLSSDWTHLAAFLFVSHPRPVAAAIDSFRRKIDSDPMWIEIAAFTDAEGRPFRKTKAAIARYVGGAPGELALTSNTTTALAMAYHGLRIRADQEILTTEHDHYVHHESIRYACERSGAAVRRVALYDRAAEASSGEMVGRLARAIGEKTRAVGVTWVHSSTGVKVPIPELAEAVSRANRGRAEADRCLLIVDGVHGFANQDVDVAKLGADFFAAGMHKWLCAPRGTGFLWGRADAWPHLRPTIPSFDPDEQETWQAWMERRPLAPTEASFVSPGGFLAYEHFLAVPAAIELQHAIGRDRVAARIAETNGAFREAAAKLPNVTLVTPRDPGISGGLTCFEVAGFSAGEVTERLRAQRISTSSSPYKVSYPRVSAGVMNSLEDIEIAVRALRALKS